MRMYGMTQRHMVMTMPNYMQLQEFKMRACINQSGLFDSFGQLESINKSCRRMLVWPCHAQPQPTACSVTKHLTCLSSRDCGKKIIVCPPCQGYEAGGQLNICRQRLGRELTCWDNSVHAGKEIYLTEHQPVLNTHQRTNFARDEHMCWSYSLTGEADLSGLAMPADFKTIFAIRESYSAHLGSQTELASRPAAHPRTTAGTSLPTTATS